MFRVLPCIWSRWSTYGWVCAANAAASATPAAALEWINIKRELNRGNEKGRRKTNCKNEMHTLGSARLGSHKHTYHNLCKNYKKKRNEKKTKNKKYVFTRNKQATTETRNQNHEWKKRDKQNRKQQQHKTEEYLNHIYAALVVVCVAVRIVRM